MSSSNNKSMSDDEIFWNIVLFISISLFFIINSEAGYLNYLLFLLGIFLLTPIRLFFEHLLTPLKKYLENKSKYFLRSFKTIIFSIILLCINFLLFQNISKHKYEIGKLEKNNAEINQIIKGIVELNKYDNNLVIIDSHWNSIKKIVKNRKENISELNQILYKKVLANSKIYFYNREYENAIKQLEYLLESNFKTKELYYLLGASFYNLFNLPNAIYYFNLSAQLGNQEALIMYEKLNPIKKKDKGIYYTLLRRFLFLFSWKRYVFMARGCLSMELPCL